MAFDYKKEYKEFYMPKGTPSIVTVPKMNYIAVRGSGNPNDEDGEYKQAIGLLYGIARLMMEHGICECSVKQTQSGVTPRSVFYWSYSCIDKKWIEIRD